MQHFAVVDMLQRQARLHKPVQNLRTSSDCGPTLSCLSHAYRGFCEVLAILLLDARLQVAAVSERHHNAQNRLRAAAVARLRLETLLSDKCCETTIEKLCSP